MPYYDGVKSVTSSLIIGFTVAVASSVIHSGPVQGMADNIQVMVCPQPSQSSLTISQPQSDSVVNESKLSVGGSVAYISQIDLFIDGRYNNTVALGYTATEFSSEVTLEPGTHTIQFVASDSCSQTTHERSVVVTYVPKTPASVGENVDTVIDGRVRQGVNLPDVAVPEKNIIEKAIDRFITPPVEIVKNALDIGGPGVMAPAVRTGNVVRSLLFVTGGLLTLSAVHTGAFLANVLPTKISSLLPLRRREATIVALIGLVMMLLVFIV